MYFKASWENVALWVILNSGKSTDVTCETHLGYLAAQLTRVVDLALLVFDMNWWLSCRVLAVESVVGDSISSGEEYSILMMRPNKVETAMFPYIMRRSSADFLVIVIQFSQ